MTHKAKWVADPAVCAHTHCVHPPAEDKGGTLSSRCSADVSGKDGAKDQQAAGDDTAHTVAEIAGIIMQMTKTSLGSLLCHPGHATVGGSPPKGRIWAWLSDYDVDTEAARHLRHAHALEP